jgi:hypothetical protein
LEGGEWLLAANCCRQPIRSLWLAFRSIFSTFFLAAIAGVSPVHASESANWIPLEEQTEIRQRQYPEKYPAPLFLPDLQTLPPSDLRLEEAAGKKFVRFANTIWNRGPGLLELRGAYNREAGTISVTQNIYREDGELQERQAGEFEFHATHGHWHWEAFSLYQVWSVKPDGGLDQPVTISDKVGYCLRDIAPHDDFFASEMVNQEQNQSPRPGYTSCYWARQGLSVGWQDTYRAHVSGQRVDITHLPDGVYALKSSVDPEGIIREGENSNNSAVVYFSIGGDQIDVLGDSLIPFLLKQEYE